MGTLVRDYENPLVSLNKAFLGPAISWGKRGLGSRAPLDCHDLGKHLDLSRLFHSVLLASKACLSTFDLDPR